MKSDRHVWQDGFSALPDRRARRQRGRGEAAPFYPEGGWGYVVVLAAFIALMTQMGLIVSMGVYLEHIEKEFESGAGLSGWISSGCFAVLAFVSPLASHVMKRLGCRPTAMIGGVIMCAGFVCGTFANSVVQLFVFADVIGGIGASMCHISGTVVIGQYFNKKYALANGFAYTGQGVGIFMFPPILQALIGMYGWRGCMLVQGALSLHISAAAALYRPVKRPPGLRADHSASGDDRKREEIHSSNGNQNRGADSISCSATSEESDSKTDSTASAVFASELDSCKPSVAGNSANSSEHAELKTPTIPAPERMEPPERPIFSESRMENLTAVSAASELDCFPTDSINGPESTVLKPHMDDSEEPGKHFQQEPQEDTRFLTEFDANPRICFSSHLNSKASTRNVSTAGLMSSSNQTVVNKSDECWSVLDEELGVLGPEGFRRRKSCLVAWRMVRDHPSVCFIFLIFFFESFGYGGFFSHAVAKARETGIKEGPATFALSVFGIGSLVGRITNGFILHHGHLTGKGLNALALVTAGLASALTSAVVSQAGLFAGAFFSGLGSGWYLPLQQVLLRDIVGQTRLHLAYGYGLLFEGAGSLAGGFVIGSIRDVHDSYVVSFYFLGVVMLLGACILAVDRFFEKRVFCRSKDRRRWMAYSNDAKEQQKATPV